jgi:citrate lyase subunit beta/citryl-CoA lyase
VGDLANIEAPKGLRLAADIATAHPRVIGLQIGYGDLLEPAGIDRTDEAALQHVRLAVRFAAAEAARRLGFAGKSCIHPSQVGVVNEAFNPRPEEIARARRILTAAADATARGVGAFMVEGQMVDAPFIAQTRALVDLAERVGLAAPQ